MIYYGVSLSFPILNMFTLRTEIVDAFPKKVDWRKSQQCYRWIKLFQFNNI